MREVNPKKERETEYNVYTDKDRNMYFILAQKGMKPKEVVASANTNYHTVRKRKKTVERLK
jgi:hypothetical protein